MIRTALLSVSDKHGIVDFAKALHALGVQLISTGGTAKLLAEKSSSFLQGAPLSYLLKMVCQSLKSLH